MFVNVDEDNQTMNSLCKEQCNKETFMRDEDIKDSEDPEHLDVGALSFPKWNWSVYWDTGVGLHALESEAAPEVESSAS